MVLENSKFKNRRFRNKIIEKLKKYRFLCFLLLIIAITYITSNYWLPLTAKYLIICDRLQESDIIIVPSGSSQNLRIEYAVEIYKKQYAPKILLCGELALQKETGINLGKIYAVSLGVSETDILTEENSQSTFENALFSKKIIKEQECRSVILVTYPTHTRRTKKIFKEIFPKDVKIIACCNIDDFDTNNWWKDRNRAREVVYEYFAFVWHALFEN
jgi:uncharacterized SAM-binding protein YcdF (DUF218 family)